MFIKKAAAILAAMTMFASATAFAADVNVTLNGQAIEMPAEPYIKNDRTMVSLRGVFEAVGATVSWDDETRTAIVAQQISEDEVKFIFLQIGASTAFVNEDEKLLDAPAEISEDRTMVPLSFIMENLGYEVTWNAETRTADIVK